MRAVSYMREVFQAIRHLGLLQVLGVVLRREVPPFQIIPWHMGVAYRSFVRDVTVCYIIPLNWVVRGLLRAWVGLKGILPPGVVDREQKAAYDVGYIRGYAAGKRRTERQLQTLIQTYIEELRTRGQPGDAEDGPGLIEAGAEVPQGGNWTEGE